MTTPEASWMEFGREIELARKSRGWSQSRLAGRADVSPTSLGRLERGEVDPTASTPMVKIAVALGWPAKAADRWMAGDHSFLEPTASSAPAGAAGYDSRISKLDPDDVRYVEAIIEAAERRKGIR